MYKARTSIATIPADIPMTIPRPELNLIINSETQVVHCLVTIEISEIPQNFYPDTPLACPL
jgi:hypothetical protein